MFMDSSKLGRSFGSGVGPVMCEGKFGSGRRMGALNLILMSCGGGGGGGGGRQSFVCPCFSSLMSAGVFGTIIPIRAGVFGPSDREVNDGVLHSCDLVFLSILPPADLGAARAVLAVGSCLRRDFSRADGVFTLPILRKGCIPAVLL